MNRLCAYTLVLGAVLLLSDVFKVLQRFRRRRPGQVLPDALAITLMSFRVSARVTGWLWSGFKDYPVKILSPLLIHSLQSMQLQFPLRKVFPLIHLHRTDLGETQAVIALRRC